MAFIKTAKLDITPDKTLIKKLGQTGYRTENAIAELIDNSIDARIASKPLLVKIILNYTDKKIVVEDNGIGMNKNELQNALTIAKETKKSKKQLGQFGMGMKSACSTLGRQFIITTAKPNSNQILTATYDESEWLNSQSKDWKNFAITISQKTDDWHGTKIEINKINVSLYANQATNFKRNFGKRYVSYLKNSQVSIKINQFLCKPVERELLDGSKKIVVLHMTKSADIQGWIGLTKKRSAKGEYGFDLYKNNRLIQSNAKLGLRNHPEVSRITGEFHFDTVPVNFNKTQFIEDSDIFMEAKLVLTNNKYLNELLSSERYQIHDRSASIATVYDYLKGTKTRVNPIKTQISYEGAKKILNLATPFEFKQKSKKIIINYADLPESRLYNITKNSNGAEIIINRNSPTFKILKNPLFLIGLISIESRLITEGIRNVDDFIIKRNDLWNRFVADFSPLDKPQKKQESSHKNNVDDQPLYGLPSELVELNDYLNEQYNKKFQFTALSILSQFLEYGLKNKMFMIYARNGTGENLLAFIQQYTDNFTLLLDPTSKEIETAVAISKKPLLIIREYAQEELTSPVATHAKAWLDLYREIKLSKTPIVEDELVTTLDRLNDLELVTRDEIEKISKRRKNYSDIIQYTEQVFGSANS